MEGDSTEAGHRRGGARVALTLRGSARLAVWLGVVATIVAGCGGESAQTGTGRAGSSEVELTAREADCSDWNRASADQRQATVEALREFAGGPTTGGTGAVLSDEKAYELFESYCSSRSARAFELYRLYARAAAFQSVP